jgi:hypothetical protein
MYSPHRIGALAGMTLVSETAVTVEIRPDAHAVVLHVHDASSAGLLAVRRATLACVEVPGTEVRVDLGETAQEGASTFWLAALVALARIARARRCRLVVTPPAHLAPVLTRLGLEAAQGPRPDDPGWG